MIGFKQEECKACHQKDEFIAKLTEAHYKPCVSCVNFKDQVIYLQGLIEQLRKDRENEREEYKRTVDRLLESRGMGAVGQGVSPGAAPFNPKDLADMFEEVAEPKGAVIS